ncbi:hypothetical protein Ancab_033277 [Ancistrocladus abbreviatus]
MRRQVNNHPFTITVAEEIDGGLGGWAKSLQLNHKGSKGSSNVEWSKTLSRVPASPIGIYSDVLEIHNVEAEKPEEKSPCGSEMASAQSTNGCLCYRKSIGNLHEIGTLNAIVKEKENIRPKERGMLAIAPPRKPKVRREKKPHLRSDKEAASEEKDETRFEARQGLITYSGHIRQIGPIFLPPGPLEKKCQTVLTWSSVLLR